MKLEVTVDGAPQVVDVDVADMTEPQQIAACLRMGEENWSKLEAGIITPESLQAMLFVKLVTDFPGLKPENIDVSV